MNYSESIAHSIEDYLKENDWTYDFDAIHGVISVEAELSCRLASAIVVYQVAESGFFCYTGLAVDADAPVRAQVGEYLHRANYGLPNGNFEFDYDDGSIHYKTVFDCPDGVPSQKQLEDSMAIGLTVVDHYGDGLYEIMNSRVSLAKKLIGEMDGAE